MKVMILGATGLLGQAMLAEAVRRGYSAITVARHEAAITLDISNEAALSTLLSTQTVDAVINCAALVDINACERDPGLAWAVNGRPVAIIAEWARAHDRPFLHVSTDQFFVNGADLPHMEDAPVTFVNEYARTKFAGEALALTVPQALVLRTSIVGIRGWARPTFAEWAIDVVRNDRPVTLFTDAYTSSIDVATFSRAAFDLLKKNAHGLYNVAASAVYSKEAFVREMARQLGCPLSYAQTGTVTSLATRRANCLGLDVSKAEAMLGYALPDLTHVIASVLAGDKKRVS